MAISKLREKSIAVYPGSFDPITLGHTEIIDRVSNIFDEVILLIAENSSKKSLFTFDERKSLISKIYKNSVKVKIKSHHGLLVDFMKENQYRVLIRGMRSVSDFDYEFSMANTNRHLNTDIETFIVFASTQTSFISSNIVKEVAQHGGNLKGLVHQEVANVLKKRFS